MSVRTDWDQSRRDLLKYLGVGLGCLPILQGGRVWGAAATTPKRLLIFVITNGYRQQYWRPMDGSLMTQTLPDSSSPLEPHKADLIFLPGLTHPSYPGRNQHGAYVNNLAAGANDGMKEYRVPFTPTLDQVVGDGLAKMANLTRSTLNTGILVDQGTAGIFPSKRSFWRSKTDPINPEPNPYKTYQDIFVVGGNKTASDDLSVKKLMAHQKSLLDYIGDDLQRFQARLGTDDKLAISGHMDAVRDLEKQLQTPRASAQSCGGDPGMPLDYLNVANYPQLVTANLGLMLAALKCDVTRVAGLQTADATGANIPFSFVPGIPVKGTGYDNPQRNWHDIAHTPVLAGVDHKRIVDKWWMGQLADLLAKMKAVPEPGGTMLDNSAVLMVNCMEEGANHDTQKIPWILAGKCGGYFKTGVCAPSAGKPLNGVLAEICDAMGVPVPYFGDPSYGQPMAGLATTA